MGGTFVAGHNGLVGSAVCRALAEQGTETVVAGRSDLDLRDQAAVCSFFDSHRPARLVIAAAVVGGIKANGRYPGMFIGENLMIQTNLLDAARRFGTERTVFVSSASMYPGDAPVPTKEEHLLTGAPAPGHEWYAVAKIAGTKMAQAYSLQYGMECRTLVPCNLYGPCDNFDPENSHVVPAMLLKFHEAKVGGAEKVEMFGSGSARREFLHVDDFAEACVLALDGKLESEVANVGSGVATTIAELAKTMRETVGYSGGISWEGKLDGESVKLIDSERIRRIGWLPKTSLEEGLRLTYDWMLDNAGRLRTSRLEEPLQKSAA